MNESEKDWWKKNEFKPLKARGDRGSLDTSGEYPSRGWWQRMSQVNYELLEEDINRREITIRRHGAGDAVLLEYGLMFQPRIREHAVIRLLLMENEMRKSPGSPEFYTYSYTEKEGGTIEDAERIDVSRYEYYGLNWDNLITVAKRPKETSVPIYGRMINNFINRVNRRLSTFEQPRIPLFPPYGY